MFNVMNEEEYDAFESRLKKFLTDEGFHDVEIQRGYGARHSHLNNEMADEGLSGIAGQTLTFNVKVKYDTSRE